MGKILLFGGTFDPPHKGHRHLLDVALQQEHFDRVFLIPSYIPPHKAHRPSLSFEARKGLLLSRFGEIPGIEVLDIEQKREGKSYTIDTVTALQAEYPEDTFYFLIGSDMLLCFDRWVRAEELLQRLILVVGSRENGDLPRLEAKKKELEERFSCKGIILCKMEAVVCASSSLRAAGDGMAEEVLRFMDREMDVKRVCHTMQVADYAAALAPKFAIDPEKAYLAGLLHDCTKCYSAEWQLSYAEEQGISLSPEDRSCPQILHQITGPVFARQRFGCADEEVLSAIGCHTTGKPGMAPLEMLIFFADACEPSRNYPGVEEIRKAGEEDLSRGTLMLLEHTVSYIESKKQFLHPQTAAARDDLIKELEKNG